MISQYCIDDQLVQKHLNLALIVALKIHHFLCIDFLVPSPLVKLLQQCTAHTQRGSKETQYRRTKTLNETHARLLPRTTVNNKTSTTGNMVYPINASNASNARHEIGLPNSSQSKVQKEVILRYLRRLSYETGNAVVAQSGTFSPQGRSSKTVFPTLLWHPPRFISQPPEECFQKPVQREELYAAQQYVYPSLERIHLRRRSCASLVTRDVVVKLWLSTASTLHQISHLLYTHMVASFLAFLATELLTTVAIPK